MLTIRRTQVLRGPSIWAPVPVIILTVAIGELENRLKRETPVFFDRLVELLPSLETHAATVAQPELGFARLLLGPIALALQQQAGVAIQYSATHPTDGHGLSRVVYAYDHEDVGRAAGQVAVRLLNHLLYGSEPAFAFADELVKEIIGLIERHTAGPFLDTVVAAARRRSIPVLELSSSPPLLQLGTGAYQRRLAGLVPTATAGIASTSVSDPALTRRLLDGVGVPFAAGLVVRDIEGAVQVARHLGFPVVLMVQDRPPDPGLRLALESEAAVRTAFPGVAREARSRREVVTCAPGTFYHLLVVGERVVAVAERPPTPGSRGGSPRVADSVGERDDQETPAHMALLDRNRENSADDGQVVPPPANGRQIAIDRTTEIHPDNVAIARLAAQVVGLAVAGIDVITPDIARSLFTEGGGIVAVDAAPDLRRHTHPTEGTPRDVGMAIVDHLFPPGQPVRVPIVAVTGTNGKTTTTRMISHILTTAGMQVGMTTTDGIHIAGTQIATGDQAGAPAARQVLRNPAIDYAVLETAHGSILKHGLGFDRCDVAVVTNVAADHLGTAHLKTLEDLAQVKAVVARAAMSEGASVVNADDPLTVAMAEVAGGEIVYFSMTDDSSVVHDHLQQGGRAVVLRQSPAGEVLTLLANGGATSILPVAEIPATMEGRIRVNIANALAASATAIAQEVPLATIRAALHTFANSLAQTPGRFNVLDIDGRTVVQDYCHNLHGLEALADFVRRMGAPHTVAALYITGDRTDEHITAFGRLAAQIFDELVIRDVASRYQYMRDRTPGEVPALLHAAALAAGLEPEKIRLAHDKEEAADLAMARSRSGSLVVLLGGEDPAGMSKHLTQRHHEATV